MKHVTVMVLAGLLVAGATIAKDGDKDRTEVAGEAVNPYPLKNCLVSGEELGSMGETYRLVFEQQELKFCCKGCVKDFKKDPPAYLAKLAAAVKEKGEAEEKHLGSGHKEGNSHSGHNH